jgi:hypothetical protein
VLRRGFAVAAQAVDHERVSLGRIDRSWPVRIARPSCPTARTARTARAGKGRFHVLAEKDKTRYDGEMANYKPPKGEKGGKKRKRTKDPNAPKRALSAFFWFCNDERPRVKEGMTDATVGEVAKELGRRWNDCTEEQKSKYEALAAKDKARYEKEVKAYKAKKGKPAPVKAPPKKEESEEEDDDDADEDDEDDDDDDDD